MESEYDQKRREDEEDEAEVQQLLEKPADECRKLPPEADRELTRLWRTWITVLQMLHDRVCLTSVLPHH